MVARTEESQTGLTKWGWNTVSKQIISPLTIAPLLLWLAGWLFNVAHMIMWTGNTLALLWLHPDLLNARGRGTKSDTKTWDMVLLSLYGIAWLVLLGVGAWDHRMAWTPPLPIIVPLIGAVLMLAGFGLATWAMIANWHFEVSVRIQTDRTHTVYTGGPYRLVRHPVYTGVILAFFVGMPLALGSWTAFIPAAIGAAVMILRTALEDRTLQRELDGYTAFTAQTRYRLVPGLW